MLTTFFISKPIFKNNTAAYIWIFYNQDMRIYPADKYARTFNDIELSFPMKNGRYKVEFWDTRSGKITKELKHTVTANEFSIKNITFTRDIALKLKINE